MTQGVDDGPPIVTHPMMGMDGEAPACQPPTTAPSPHRATVDVVQCEDAGNAGAMCTDGGVMQVSKSARAVVPW